MPGPDTWLVPAPVLRTGARGPVFAGGIAVRMSLLLDEDRDRGLRAGERDAGPAASGFRFPASGGGR